MNEMNILDAGEIRFERAEGYEYRQSRRLCGNVTDPAARELWDTVMTNVSKNGKTVLYSPDTASSVLAKKIDFYMNDPEHIYNRFTDEKPTGKQIYKAAGFSRSKWNRILSGELADIERGNAFALAVALRLDEEQTEDFLHAAGFSLNYEIDLDCAIMYFIRKGIYDMPRICAVLSKFSNITNGLDCFAFCPRTDKQKPIRD